jgi:predicted Holliday junction resolvase-like endonuclease
VISGKVYEQLLPYLPDFPYNPKDVRFLGSPVDLVVFDGLDRGLVERVVFIEVKTGQSNLTRRERQVRDAVKAGRVDWLELRRDV